jgi:starvation-inducible DNA-binding protein
MVHIAPEPTAVAHLQDAAIDLQVTLVELVDLSLQAKQLHWNVTGPAFKPLHEMLDEFAGEYRDWSDMVAERLAALGRTPDGRVGTVARESVVEALPAGSIADRDVIHFLYDRICGVAARIRARMNRLGDSDLVSQDVLIEVVRGLEKQRWMVGVQRS